MKKIEGKIKKETQKAILFSTHEVGSIWLPKSQISYTANSVRLPEWLYEEKANEKVAASVSAALKTEPKRYDTAEAWVTAGIDIDC